MSGRSGYRCCLRVFGFGSNHCAYLQQLMMLQLLSSLSLTLPFVRSIINKSKIECVLYGGSAAFISCCCCCFCFKTANQTLDKLNFGLLLAILPFLPINFASTITSYLSENVGVFFSNFKTILWNTIVLSGIKLDSCLNSV